MSGEAFRFFKHCPRCGVSADGVDRNPFACQSCGFLLYFNAASAVAAFVVRDDGCVLYVRRAHDPGKGMLGLPGGFVDLNETAEEALRREVREEVGLELADGPRYLVSFPNRYDYAGVTYLTLDLFFVATATDISRLQSLDAVGATVWCDPTAVDPREIAFVSMRRALEVFRSSTRSRRGPPAAE